MTFPERVIEALQISALALQKAEGQLQEKQAAATKLAERIPVIVDKCVRFGRIDDTPEEREKLAAWLATPDGVLEVVDRLAEHRVEPSPDPALSLGRPMGTSKQAAGNQTCVRVIGQRSSAEPEAWHRLAANLGLA